MRDGLSAFRITQQTNVAPNASAAPITAPSENVKEKNNWLPLILVIVLCVAAAADAIVSYPQQSVEQAKSISLSSATATAPLPSPTAPSLVSFTPKVMASPSVTAVVGTSPARGSQTPRPQSATLSATVSINTPSGKVTLSKGLRLPLVATKHDSVVVHYFDGNDYSIPLSSVTMDSPR